MMREPHPTELLSAYFDRELSRVERARIESHLAGCDECRALLDDWERLAAAQRGDVPPVPERLAARIEERVFGARPAPRPRRTFGWVRQVSLAAAALVVVGVVAGYFALRGGPGTGEGIGAPVPAAPPRSVENEAPPPPPPARKGTAPASKRGAKAEARAPQGAPAGAAKGAFAPAPPLPAAAPEAASSAAEEAAPAAAGGAEARESLRAAPAARDEAKSATAPRDESARGEAKSLAAPRGETARNEAPRRLGAAAVETVVAYVVASVEPESGGPVSRFGRALVEVETAAPGAPHAVWRVADPAEALRRFAALVESWGGTMARSGGTGALYEVRMDPGKTPRLLEWLEAQGARNLPAPGAPVPLVLELLAR